MMRLNRSQINLSDFLQGPQRVGKSFRSQKMVVPLIRFSEESFSVRMVNPEQPSLETQLLQRMALGDQDAFPLFYDRYCAVLYSFAARILIDFRAAEEVVQEVFLVIWEKSPTYNPNLGSPLTWALTLTRNKSIDRLRSEKRQIRLLEKAGEESLAQPDFMPHTAGAGMDQKDRAVRVRQAMQELPGEQRHLIELAFFGGHTQSEICEMTGQPLGTVKARIRRGMLKLKTILEENG